MNIEIFVRIATLLCFLMLQLDLCAGDPQLTEQILPLLQKSPEFFKRISNDFELDPDGWITRLDKRENDVVRFQFTHYLIRMRPKGSSDAWRFTLDVTIRNRLNDPENGTSQKNFGPGGGNLISARILPIAVPNMN